MAYKRITDTLDTESQVIAYESWEEGLNNKDSAEFISPKSLSISKNALVDERGRIRKAKGITAAATGATGTTGRGIGQAKFINGTQWCFLVSGGTLYRWASGDAALTNLGAISDILTAFVQAKDLMFVLNGTDNVKSVNSLGAVTDEGNGTTDPIRSKTGTWAGNRLFLANDDDDLLYFSDLNAPQTFTRATNFFRVGNQDGRGRIKAIIAYKVETTTNVAIFKEGAIYLLDINGADPLVDWRLILIDNQLGTTSPKSVKQVGNDIFFVDQYGQVRSLVRTQFDKLNTVPQSYAIRGTLDDINFSQLAKIAGAVYQDSYILFYPEAGSAFNNSALLYSNITKSWSGVLAGWKMADAVEFVISGKVELLGVEGSGVGGLFRLLNGTSQAGSGIDFEIAGRRENLGTDSEKYFDNLTIEALALGNYNLTVQGEIDQGGFTTLGTMSLKGNAPTLPLTLPFTLRDNSVVRKDFWAGRLGPGRTFRWKLTNGNADEDVTVTSVTLSARPLAYRRT